MLLDVAGYAYPVEGLGPGRRLVLWVRGCHRCCPGCITPELWAPGTPTPLNDVLAALRPYLAEAEAVSISGGEPFDQAEALAAFLDLLTAERDVEVLVYTGFTLEELRARPNAAPLLARIDLLIDGPFLTDAPNTTRWRGSDNQRVHLLSPRAARYAEEQDAPWPEPRPLQVQSLGGGAYRIIGIPRRGDLTAYHAAMAARGFEVDHNDG